MTKDNSITDIKETMDYNKFERGIFQRPLRDLTLLKSSMQKNGFKTEYPIIVKSINKNKYEILSGHHRFQAAKELLIPIKYIISDDFNDTLEFETLTKEWSLKDYLHSNIATGNKNYIAVQQYKDKTNIPVSTVIFILSNAEGNYNNIVKDFKLGKFEIKNLEFAKTMLRIIKQFKDNNITAGSSAKFVRALSLCMKVESFDIDYLINKIIKRPSLLIAQTTTEKYIKHIDEIYNYGLKSKRKLAIAFEVNKNKK